MPLAIEHVIVFVGIMGRRDVAKGMSNKSSTNYGDIKKYYRSPIFTGRKS